MRRLDLLTDDEGKMVFAYIMQRATEDSFFRDGLLKTPKKTLEKELGIELPNHFNIRFIDNEGADLTIVLPDLSDQPLSDSDLEYVAGGVDVVQREFVEYLFKVK